MFYVGPYAKPCSEPDQRPNIEGPLENTLVTGNVYTIGIGKDELSKYDICFLKILLKDTFLEVRKLVIFAEKLPYLNLREDGLDMLPKCFRFQCFLYSHAIALFELFPLNAFNQ